MKPLSMSSGSDRFRLFMPMLLVISIMAVNSGCQNRDGCLCTEVFVTQMVLVSDQTSRPLDGVQVTVTFTNSGIPANCSQYNDAENGLYCIMNDNYVDRLDEQPTPVTVIYEKPGYVTQVLIYYFNTDSCHCHISLLGGETTVIMLEGCSGP